MMTMKCILVLLNDFKMHIRIFCTVILGKFEKNIYQHVLLFSLNYSRFKACVHKYVCVNNDKHRNLHSHRIWDTDTHPLEYFLILSVFMTVTGVLLLFYNLTTYLYLYFILSCTFKCKKWLTKNYTDFL